MAVPVIQSETAADSGGSGATSITINKPTGVVSGDLLVAILGSDDNTNNDQWGGPHTGWTKIQSGGTAASDAHLGVFYREADGTEGSSFSFTHGGSVDQLWAKMLRIDGHDSTSPINVSNLEDFTSAATAHDIDAITTTVDDCLAINAFAFDGADATFSLGTAVGWTLQDTIKSGTAGSDASGTWATKSVSSAGSTGTCDIVSSVADTGVAIMFAVAGDSGSSTTIAPNDISLSLTIDNANITQNHVLATSDLSLTLTTDNTSITQNHVIVPQDLSLGLSADNTTITQNHVIAPDDLSISLTSDNTTVSEETDVSVGDTGSNSLGTSINVTLPSYTADDLLIVVYSRNNGGTQTFETNVTATELANAGGRLGAYKIVPDTLSETDFDITGTNSYWSWAMLKIENADLTADIVVSSNAIGNNTTSNIEVEGLDLGFIATGDEEVISVASVNSTASWTTSGNTIYNTTSGNAALLINNTQTTADDITDFPADIDRGLNGTTRLESTLTFAVQKTPNGTNNMLTNGSFEEGTTLATDWVDEGTQNGTVTYSLTSTGMEDGELAQRVEYTGHASDNGTQKLQFYQAPINSGFSIGDEVQFSIYVSGSMTDTYASIGVEAFESDTTYISDVATNITSVTSTPTEYKINYTVPANTGYLAVFIQTLELESTSSVDLKWDKAVLRIAPPDDHILASNGLSLSLTADNTTIAQNHIIATQDLDISLGLDTTTLTQNHVIAPQDLSQVLTLDSTSITQNHVIAVEDISLGLVADNTAITQNHTISTNDISLDLSLDNSIILAGTNYTIDTNDISLDLTTDNASIELNHIINTNNLSFGSSLPRIMYDDAGQAYYRLNSNILVKL